MYRCGSISITENSHPPLAAFFKPHTLGLSMSNFPVPEHMEQGSTSPCLLCARIDLARIMTANYIYPKQSQHTWGFSRHIGQGGISACRLGPAPSCGKTGEAALPHSHSCQTEGSIYTGIGLECRIWIHLHVIVARLIRRLHVDVKGFKTTNKRNSKTSKWNKKEERIIRYPDASIISIPPSLSQLQNKRLYLSVNCEND